MREALEELGPTFCKLGQILSTRADLLPPAFIEELSKLQDQRPARSPRPRSSRSWSRPWECPWEDVFATIDPQPLAAGTIAQVHKATLAGGARVIVKVQRPGAKDDIMRDLGLLQLFAEKSRRRPGLRQMVDLPAVSEHLSTSLGRELDFRVEASNIDRMRGILADYPMLGVPASTTSSRARRCWSCRRSAAWPCATHRTNETSKKAARQFLESYYKQLLDRGLLPRGPAPRQPQVVERHALLPGLRDGRRDSAPTCARTS